MSCGKLDIYDQGGGAILVAWAPFPGLVPDSFNLYVNGVLNQSGITNPGQPLLAESGQEILAESGLPLLVSGGSVGGIATVTGLTAESYSASAIPPAGDGSHRPESLPPVGLITDAQTYLIRVAAVIGGIEVAASPDTPITVQPQSVMLTTPMARGRFAFPNTPGGY